MSWCGGGEIRLDARRRVPGLGDPGVDLVPQAVARPRPGLAPWAILICRSSALTRYSAGHAEPAARHLLDRRPAQVTVSIDGVPVGVLAAFAGVGAAAEPVHRDRQRLVRLGRQRPVRHRPGAEPPHDRRDRLDLVKRDRRRAGAARASIVDAPDPRAARASVIRRADWSSISLLYCRKIACWPDRVACCSLNTASGLNRCGSAIPAPGVLAARREADRRRARPAGQGSAAQPGHDARGDLVDTRSRRAATRSRRSTRRSPPVRARSPRRSARPV